MSELRDDRRKEPRRPASGPVVLTLEGPEALQVEGRLVDVSDSGFRVAHTHQSLLSGQTFQFRHAAAAGRARVVWNRIVADHVESGFFVLKEAPQG